MDRQARLETFAQRLGFPFRHPSLLDQALTHSSYANENPAQTGGDNQRLEYLGDAILGFIVAEWLFRHYPAAQEGELTRWRAHLVRSESLAQLGHDLGIGEFLLMGRGEEAGGGRDREANLCAAVEALIGAVYLDRGLETTRALVQHLLEHAEIPSGQEIVLTNPKGYLQEYTQAALQITPTYAIISEHGPDHDRQFVARVFVDGQMWGEGSGRTKQAAEQQAARVAIQQRSL